MSSKKKRKNKVKNKNREIVTKRILEYGFEARSGKDRFKTKAITLYE